MELIGSMREGGGREEERERRRKTKDRNGGKVLIGQKEGIKYDQIK